MNALHRSWRTMGRYVLAWLFVLALEGTALGQTTAAVGVQTEPKPRSWFARHFGTLSWEQFKSQCLTPRDICREAERRISYRSDEVDYWAGPEETWRTRRGDCEDFATVVEGACHLHGAQASVELYFPSHRPGEGHAIVVGTWQGKMWMSDMGSYREVTSREEIRDRVARSLDCDPEDMWVASLDREGVERFLKRGTRQRASPVRAAGRIPQGGGGAEKRGLEEKGP